MYYKPTAAGLEGYSCNVKVDWPALLTRLRHVEVSDSDPLLQYLASSRLSMTDDLRRGGTLEWSPAGIPRPEVEKAVDKMRSGLQQMFQGFFQNWNGYLNGTLVPAPDQNTVVTPTEDGYHLHATSPVYVVDEDFDKGWLLKTVHVVSPHVEVTQYPLFDRRPEGLIVKSVRSVVHQTSDAGSSMVTVSFEYASADGFVLPSHFQVIEANVGIFDFDLTECHARVFDPGQLPKQHK